MIPKCPDNYELKKDICQCKKIKKAKKKTNKKTRKKTNKKTRCPKGTRKNKKTNKCESILVLKDTTPKELKELRQVVQGKKHHSFSPNVNQIISSLKSVSPHKEFGLNKCKYLDDKIYIEKNGKGKCYGIKSKIAQTYMLDNLLSKKPIDCGAIIAPRQKSANCWFNSFFMIYFISDKGRKFFRYLRMAMITGQLPNGEPVNPKLRMPLLLLNKYIEASLIGTGAKSTIAADRTFSHLATLMDTNVVIRKVARNLGKERKDFNIVKTQKASNPYVFYSGLIKYLKSNPLTFLKIQVRHALNSKTLNKEINALITNQDESDNFGPKGPLDFFVLERWAAEFPIKSWTIPQNIKIKYKGEIHNYALDSAVLEDISRIHFSAYITCNGKPMAFDGESFSRLVPFEWKKKMNKDAKWRFAEQFETYFNFRRGYYMLFYYRV
jgi:hypothetical protein